jgi:fatty-acyl-CoA synthase
MTNITPSENFKERLIVYSSRLKNKPAFVFFNGREQSQITFGELADRVFRCPLDSPKQSGHVVLIEGHQRPSEILEYLCLLFAGLTPGFISPLTSRQNSNQWKSDRDELKARFTSHHLTNKITNFADFGFIQFTSGTTGLRKGVYIPMTRLASHLSQLEQELVITDEDVVVSWLPTYHDMGLITSLLLPLFCGITTVLLDPVLWSYRPLLFVEAVKRYRGTLAWQPNFAFDHLSRSLRKTNTDELAGTPLSSLRLLFNCSEPIRYSTFERFITSFSDYGLAPSTLQTAYAMAENIFAVSQSRFNSPNDWKSNRGVLTSGTPLPGVKILISNEVCDEKKDLLNAHESPLLVGGQYLADNYLPTPSDQFRKVDGTHFFFTNDVGALEDGLLYVHGRLDDTILIKGKKFLAWEIEDALNTVPGAKAGRSLAFTDEDQETVTIALECDVNIIDTRFIIRHISSKFSIAIGEVIPLKEGTLVKTSSGKIARKKSIDLLNSLRKKNTTGRANT